MLKPDANQFMLNRGDLFSNHQGWDYFIGKFFHRGIMLLDFKEHRWHRKIMRRHLAAMYCGAIFSAWGRILPRALSLDRGFSGV